jgi:hypothetical protein
LHVLEYTDEVEEAPNYANRHLSDGKAYLRSRSVPF